MKRQRLLLRLVVLLAFGSAIRADEDDMSFLFKTGVLYPLSDTWKVAVTEELYYTDSGRLYIHETDVGLEYSGLADWLTLGWYFKYAEENPDGEDWESENRPHFNVKVKSTIWDLSWSTRTRIEYRDFEEKKDQWRLRNKLLLDLPFEIPILNARPYIGDEQFWNLSENGFNQNRVYTGLKFTLMKNLKTDLYYYWGKSQKTGRWDERSVAGIDMILEF